MLGRELVCFNLERDFFIFFLFKERLVLLILEMQCLGCGTCEHHLLIASNPLNWKEDFFSL